MIVVLKIKGLKKPVKSLIGRQAFNFINQFFYKKHSDYLKFLISIIRV